ncbi:MAG: hypothetical protein JF616_01660 [Fibrobacteres bacterium]|jgi:hypothetical protein|nr:hypothetical protein [Fibrobacterota bacterium]
MIRHCAVLAIFLVGCASTYSTNNYQEDAKAEKAVFKGEKLFIAPLSSIAVSAGNSSAKVDSGKQALLINKDTLARVYNEGLNARFRKSFLKVEIVPEPDFARYNAALTDAALEESIHYYGNGKAEYYFKHPKREVLDSLGIRADLILYLTSLTVSIKDVPASSFRNEGGGGSWQTTGVSFHGGSAPTVNQTFVGGGGIEILAEGFKPKLTAFAKYILWDYGKSAAIAYGQFQIESGVNADDIRGHWEDISRTVTDRITSHVFNLD